MNKPNLVAKAKSLLVGLIILGGCGLILVAYRNAELQRRITLAAQAGDWLTASDLAVQVARQAPWRSDLWEQAGHYALLAGNPGAAIDRLGRAGLSWEKTLENAPDVKSLSTSAQADLCTAYEGTGEHEVARRCWEAMISRAGPNETALRHLAQIDLVRGDFLAASELLERLAELKPQDAQSQYQVGLVLAAHQPDKAVAYLKRAAELDSSLRVLISALLREIQSTRADDDLAYRLVVSGRALASLGRWDLAGEAFHRATLSRPDYAEAWAYLGEARQHIAKNESSAASSTMENQTGLEELQTALELDPNSVAANTFMALYWSRKNKYDLALRAIHAALLLDPKNPALQVELGNILAASGDSPGAYQAFQQAVALSPNDPSYLCSLARFSLSYEFEVSGVALPAARRAVVLAPKLPESQDTLAQVMIRLGDLDSAARFVWRALQADPDYPPAHLHLGLIYALRGEQGAAYQELTLASSLAPGSATSDQALRLLQTYFP